MKPVMPRLANLIAATRRKVKEGKCFMWSGLEGHLPYLHVRQAKLRLVRGSTRSYLASNLHFFGNGGLQFGVTF